MALTDYIMIRGSEPEGAECFQGTSGGGAADVTVDVSPSVTLPTLEPVIAPNRELPNTPISEDEELANGIWEGQNEKLRAENTFCDQLQQQFKEKYDRVEGWQDKLGDIIEEMFGELLSMAADATITTALTPYAGPAIAKGVGWLGGVMTEVTFEWAIDFLKTLLKRGNALLTGIKAENDKLLSIEKSRENYEYREQALERHREDIRIVLEQIKQAEKGLEVDTLIDMKAILERLADLALRDDTIEFGDTRLHSRGKVVEF